MTYFCGCGGAEPSGIESLQSQLSHSLREQKEPHCLKEKAKSFKIKNGNEQGCLSRQFWLLHMFVLRGHSIGW